MDTMRERFTSTVTELLDHDPRVALVLADIGVDNFRETGVIDRHPERAINVGIREQMMAAVASGFALEGFRPIAHSYAPFLVERAFEQVKLDLAHQDVGAILVSVGASYDWPSGGRTHQSPGDVALMATLPGWDIFVPGHPDEVEEILRRAASTDRRTYVRTSTAQNAEAVPGATERLVVVRAAPTNAPIVLAVGPTLDNVLAATAGLPVAVAYTASVRPLDAEVLRDIAGDKVILVEPYLAGTSSHEIATALNDRPLQLNALGVGQDELRNYGTPEEHDAAWGLDVAGLRSSIAQFV